MININELEKLDNKTFIELNPNVDISDLTKVNNYLYLGIRPPKQFEKLELVFKQRKILAAKYLKKYFASYEYNATDEEYISLLCLDTKKYDNKHIYERYIKKNICLIINPFINAKKTTLVDFDSWLYIKKNYPKTKNRYSFLDNEYQIYDHISIDNLLAIGIPYSYLIENNGYKTAQDTMNNILILMLKYDIDLPLIDTSNNNRILAESINLDKKVLKKIK